MEQTVLTASGLTMRYHSTLALDNLDLTLPQGKRSSVFLAPTAAERPPLSSLPQVC